MIIQPIYGKIQSRYEIIDDDLDDDNDDDLYFMNHSSINNSEQNILIQRASP